MEGAGVFIICVNRWSKVIVPKRALSTEQVAQLRDMLGERLKRLR